MEIRTGEHLGPYEIVSRLGSGGMGEVWRARDTRLDRTVAIKILPQELAGNPQFLSRFDREARAISALNHPNICTLHDVGHVDSTHYIVMEHIEGETLADRLAKGRLTIEQTLRYGIEIAAALEAAHRAGIIHRDLKPGNIMLTKTGAKLLDFGLAKAGAAAVTLDGATQHKPLTQEGTILGTFQYMAPEQLEGEEADARTDIFALGAVLYEMATGRRAFEGKTRTSLIAAIVSGAPRPIAAVEPVTPAGLQNVVDKCLEKDPDERWQTAHDVRLALEWTQSQLREATTPAHGKRQWIPWTIAALSVAALAVAASWNALRREQTARRVVHIVAPGTQRFDSLMTSMSISPDGQYVTFALNDAPALWIRNLVTGEAKKLPGTDGGQFPFWSPDSRSIAFFAQGKLKKIAISGTPPVVICDAVRGRPGAWSRDGTILFSPSTLSAIHRVSANGGTPEPVTKLDANAGETTHRWVRFLPDGNHFIFTAGAHAEVVASDRNSVYVSALDDSSRKLLLKARSQAIWSRGHLLYGRGDTLLAQPFDLDDLSFTGDPEPVATGVAYSDGFFKNAFDISDSADLIYQSLKGGGVARLKWIAANGAFSEPIGEPQRIGSIWVSPDSRRAAGVIVNPESGLDDLWLYDLEQNTASRFTPTDGEAEYSPIWTPDGQAVIFARAKGFGATRVSLIRKEVDSGRETILLTAEKNYVIIPTSVSQDGSMLLFTRSAVASSEGESEIHLLDLTNPGSARALITAAMAATPHLALFSPDQKWIVYSAMESGRPESFVIRFPEGDRKTQVTRNGGQVLFWAGGRLAVAAPSGDRGTWLPIDTSSGTVRLGEPIPFPEISEDVSWLSPANGDRFLAVVREFDNQDEAITLVSPWYRRND